MKASETSYVYNGTARPEYTLDKLNHQMIFNLEKYVWATRFVGVQWLPSYQERCWCFQIYKKKFA